MYEQYPFSNLQYTYKLNKENTIFTYEAIQKYLVLLRTLICRTNTYFSKTKVTNISFPLQYIEKSCKRRLDTAKKFFGKTFT